METPRHCAPQTDGSAGLTAAELSSSPAWYPLERVGEDRLRLVRLDEAAYRAASFLDQRLLGHGAQETQCPLAVADAAASRPAPAAHYIFHIGHVGSTLASRLLGEHPALFSVREPALLRTAAMELAIPGGAFPLKSLQALLSRTWRAQQRALIKVTSFVSELATVLLDAHPEARSVLMFSPPLTYLRCILGGPNSRIEARALAPSRLARLHRRLGAAAGIREPRCEGEWIAMSWLTEMTALSEAARCSVRFGLQPVWVDFDGFLAAPEAGLERILRGLGVPTDPRWTRALLEGPLMRQYSKAPEYPYDGALRRSVLEAAGREHAEQIRRAMSWLESLARSHPLIDEALARRG